MALTAIKGETGYGSFARPPYDEGPCAGRCHGLLIALKFTAGQAHDIATRYDKLDDNFHAIAQIASIRICWRHGKAVVKRGYDG